MLKEDKIRRAAIKACKTYGSRYRFTCPVCKRQATAEKSVSGFVMVSCSGCGKGMGWRL